MKKNKDIIDEKRGIDKGFIIGFIISLIICAFIAGLIIIQELYGLNRNFNDNLNIILCDAFSISGLLLCLFYILCYVSDEGAFDIIAYSVQLVWVMTFHRNVRETKLPKTYAEYRQLKREKPRLNLKFILFSGSLFLVVGIVFLILYNINLK